MARKLKGSVNTPASDGCATIPSTPMQIHTIEDLEAEIRTRTSASLDAAAQECARAGHVWRELETEDRGPASYCGVCLRLRLAHFEGWPIWPERP